MPVIGRGGLRARGRRVSITGRNAGQGVTGTTFAGILHTERTKGPGWLSECQHCKPNPSTAAGATRTMNALENCEWRHSQLEGLE